MSELWIKLSDSMRLCCCLVVLSIFSTYYYAQYKPLNCLHSLQLFIFPDKPKWSKANFMNDVLKNDRWLPKILTTFACDKCRSGNKWFLYAKLFGRNNPFAEWTQLFLKITYIVYTLGQTDKIWIHNEKFAQKNKIILGGRWRCHSKYNFFVISLICSLQYC